MKHARCPVCEDGRVLSGQVCSNLRCPTTTGSLRQAGQVREILVELGERARRGEL
jgi:hypothetical protein